MLATIYASHLLQLHLIPFTLPMSLNSLDREGVRLMSPVTHRYFQTVAGADDTSAGDATELKWELDEARVRCVVSFPVDQ